MVEEQQLLDEKKLDKQEEKEEQEVEEENKESTLSSQQLDVVSNSSFRIFSWFIKGLVACFGISVVALITFKVYFSPVLISGESMYPTLNDGQIWFSTVKQLKKPARGDIVTAYDVVDRVYLVKRLVAVEGDTINVSDDGFSINGLIYDSSEETKKLIMDSTTWLASHKGVDVTLQKGEYFLLGDNVSHSNDSRREGVYPEEALRTVLHSKAPSWISVFLKPKDH